MQLFFYVIMISCNFTRTCIIKLRDSGYLTTWLYFKREDWDIYLVVRQDTDYICNIMYFYLLNVKNFSYNQFERPT